MTPKTKILLIVAIAICPLAGIAILAAGVSLPTLSTLFGFSLFGMAVTANQLIARKDGNRQSYKAAASTRIYEGTLVYINSGGYADDDTASGVNTFGGISIREVNNASGSNGDLDVECWIEGTFELPGSGFTIADVGKVAYGTDNFTVNVAGTGARIGKIVEYVSTTSVMVKIDVNAAESVTADNLVSEGDIDLADGGTVTQITTATTGVTINTHSGQITTVAQNIAAAGEVTFVVTNNKVAATDNIIVGIASGSVGGTTIAAVTAIGAGSFSITLTNLHASVAETGTLVINFGVIGGSAT